MQQNSKQLPQRKQVKIWVANTCQDTSGPAGWGCVLAYGIHHKEMNGYQPETDRTRMEVFSLISGLGALKEPCDVCLYTDSIMLCSTLAEQKLSFWQRNGWKDEAGEEIHNKDLWFILWTQIQKHHVHCVHIQKNNPMDMYQIAVAQAADALKEYIEINTPGEDETEEKTADQKEKPPETGKPEQT